MEWLLTTDACSPEVALTVFEHGNTAQLAQTTAAAGLSVDVSRNTETKKPGIEAIDTSSQYLVAARVSFSDASRTKRSAAGEGPPEPSVETKVESASQR